MQQSEPTRAVPGMCVGRRRRVFETMVQDAATALLLYGKQKKKQKKHTGNVSEHVLYGIVSCETGACATGS